MRLRTQFVTDAMTCFKMVPCIEKHQYRAPFVCLDGAYATLWRPNKIVKYPLITLQAPCLKAFKKLASPLLYYVQNIN